MTRAPQHAQHAATIDAPQFVDRRGQAKAGDPVSPAAEWPHPRAMLIGGVLSGLIWVAFFAWVLS
jgi:hypothetical protein